MFPGAVGEVPGPFRAGPDQHGLGAHLADDPVLARLGPEFLSPREAILPQQDHLLVVFLPEGAQHPPSSVTMNSWVPIIRPCDAVQP